MSNETRKCECGGTMHHSSDMDDPFPGEGEGRPFFQCEMCGECVDDGPNETDRATPQPRLRGSGTEALTSTGNRMSALAKARVMAARKPPASNSFRLPPGRQLRRGLGWPG